MKKSLLAICLISSMALQAQMRITNNGNVSIGTTFPSTAKLYVQGTDNTAISVGLDSELDANKQAIHASITSNTGCNAGIYSAAYSITMAAAILMLRPSLSAGVIGVGYGNDYHGVVGNVFNQSKASTAIYGMVGAVKTGITANMAGVFTGNVKSTGSVSAISFSSTSDATLKQKIAPIEDDVMDRFCKLQPVQYYWNKEAYIKATYEDSEKFTEEQMEYVTNLIGDDVHYGLLAQDLQEIFPELVNDKEKTLSINYIELIPVLIQAVQNLNNELQELKQNTSIKRQPAYNSQPAVEDMAAVLYQNTPNPFSEQTHIKYQLPASVADARIYVYDMSGNQLGEYALSERGENMLTISANEYNAGMYLYALIADGQVVDTKRMILTK